MKHSMSFILDMTDLNKRTKYLLGLCFGPCIYIFLRYLCSSSTSSRSQSLLPGEKTRILLLPKLLKSLVQPLTLSYTLRFMRGHKDMGLFHGIICKKNRVMQVLQGFS